MDLPKRKANRLKDYNYNSPGAYFITICTHERRKLFSEIEDKEHKREMGTTRELSLHELSLHELSPQSLHPETVGAIHELPVPDAETSPGVRLLWRGEIVESFIRKLPERFDLAVENYVIMPNHIHLLIVVENGSETKEKGRSLISDAIGYLKMNVSKAIHSKSPEEKVWQRSFHDHIIRSEADYRKIWQYIEYNPAKWAEDCFFVG